MSVDSSIVMDQVKRSLLTQISYNDYLAALSLAIIDYATIVVSVFSAHFIREYIALPFIPWMVGYQLPDNYIYGIIPISYIGMICAHGLYKKRLPFWQGAEILFKACFYAAILIISLMFLSGDAKEVSRLLVVIVAMITFVALAVSRYFSKKLLAGLGIWQKPVIVIGAGKTAEILAGAFEDPYLGYKLVGFLEDNKEERSITKRYPWLGNFSDSIEVVKEYGVKEVIIAAPGLDRQVLIDLIYTLQPHVENITIVPNLFGVPLSNIEIDTFFNEKTLLIRLRNNMMLWYNPLLKRIFDVAVTVIGLVFIIPVLLVISILIYCESPGPVIFAHTRVGRDGVPFPCYKFRTMVVNAQDMLEEYLNANPTAKEEWQRDFKLKNDPRVTRIGKFLRKTSLDELPQLINVFRGEMSLVGPRPIVSQEIEKYDNSIKDYYLVRPGITGYWQVSGRNDIDYDTRVQMDTWYVRNWSIWLDITLLFKTVKVVIDKKGAY